ncbi:GNAT family N-acetyltransferase [Streptacidiphilus sp. PB12-B1b]|uniref:bifunctional acetate--CoA ligase family protein/GNAT family N-acetyltransferase n=1 Tax=Streptacidiphilus sp. PB12-B1b TaxID=2705012 RepID=UPI001CDD28C1|nr:GNAT family N-acetyltransferase [Streptacidiphilus sp. PB12-B1b]
MYPASDPPDTAPVHWEADVVLRDGGTARVRPITPDDADRLVAFYAGVSDQSKYFRFFAPYPTLSARDVRLFTHHDYVNRVGLAALVRDEFIATVRFDRIDERGRPSGSGTDAEVAFLVQDGHQGRGVASVLLEHIAAVARERGIRRFIAEVLPDNRKMGKVFTDAGYTQNHSFADGVMHFELDLEPTEKSLAVMRSREHRAEALSTKRLLAPRSVAVVGAGRGAVGVGRSVLRNLGRAGFTGALYAVNRRAAGSDFDGVPVYASIGDIAEPVDLAVVAVPADEVPAVVAACGAHGVQGLVVITAGYAETGAEGRDRQRELVRQARAAGMRVIGPNAFGLINTDPAAALNASLSPWLPARGGLGIFSQSGAIGAALLETADRRGLGISSFVSAGNRADVSGNDLLQYWEEDEATRVALLYLESFGNPRKFARLARRLAAAKPLVVIKGGVHSGSIPAGHAGALTRIPDTTVDTLFQRAGVIRVDTITELYDAADLLVHQPQPRGDRIAVVGNSDSLGLLTHDAALSAGLRPLPPQDLTTGATPEDLAAGLATAVRADDNDAVVAVVIPPIGTGGFPLFPGSGLLTPGGADGAEDTAPFADALNAAAAQATAAGKPLLLIHLALPELVESLRGSVPAYPRPERAVRALAHAVRYAAWRRDAADAGTVPELERIAEAPARRLVADALTATDARTATDTYTATDARPAAPEAAPDALPDAAPDAAAPLLRSTRLDEDATAALLGHYGIDVVRSLPAPGEADAVRAADELGYPVALKATSPSLRHRADLGSVRLDLTNETELRRAHQESTALLGPDARLVVQRMAARGVDTNISATVDPAVGAILSFGLAGAASELLGDVAHRLIPATDREVAGLIREIKAAPLLFGWHGAEPVDTDTLEELLLRVSQLVDDIPEVASVELEPVVVAPRGLSVLGAAVRLARLPARTDLGPRALG